jgi:hypothetical protein
MAPSPAKKNRRWIWFFVVVFTMAVAATAVLIAFNLRQQLKPEQLAAARRLWREHEALPVLRASTVGLMASPLGHGALVAPAALFPGRSEQGPRHYTLSYTTRVNGESESHYWVKVRAGKVVESKYNGQPEPRERFPYRGMEELFREIESYLTIDRTPGSPKTYVRAIFDDKKTGGLRWYVRSVMGQRQRVEITVDTFTVDTP